MALLPSRKGSFRDPAGTHTINALTMSIGCDLLIMFQFAGKQVACLDEHTLSHLTIHHVDCELLLTGTI